MKRTCIYILRESADSERHFAGEVRYVGKADNPEDRFLQHSRDERNRAVANWFRDRAARDINPTWDVVEIVEYEYDTKWVATETKWINYFRSIGCDLLNRTDGGEGQSGYKWTEEQRKNLSKTRRGKNKPHSEETKRKISEGMRRRRLGQPKPPKPQIEPEEVSLTPEQIEALARQNSSLIERRRREEESVRTNGRLPVTDITRRRQSVAKVATWARRAFEAEMEAYEGIYDEPLPLPKKSKEPKPPKDPDAKKKGAISRAARDGMTHLQTPEVNQKKSTSGKQAWASGKKQYKRPSDKKMQEANEVRSQKAKANAEAGWAKRLWNEERKAYEQLMEGAT